MIRFDHVSKTYPGGTRAVEDFSLTVEQGSTTVFLGTSGCGKTTLMRMVNAMVTPTSGTVFISIADTDKRAIVLPAARMHEMGFNILATSGTASVLRRNGIEAQSVRKSSEGRGDGGEPTVVDLINEGSIDLVVNTPQRSAPRNDG